MFNVQFTSSSSYTICFSVISIACTMMYCSFSSNVTGTGHCCNIRICVCGVNLFSIDKKCTLLNKHQFGSGSSNITGRMDIYKFLPCQLQCHMSVHSSYWIVLGCKLVTVVLIWNSKHAVREHGWCWVCELCGCIFV